MAKEKFELYVQLVDNTLTPGDEADFIAKPLPGESLNRNGILAEALGKNPGLEPENLSMVYDVLARTMKEALLSGKRLNTELFMAGVAFTGIVEKGVWNYDRNKVRINFTQSRDLADACNNEVHINITAQQNLSIYINSVSAAATRGSEARNTVAAGKPAVFTGKNIQLAGTDPSVGVTLRNVQTCVVTKVDADMFSQNTKSKLAFVIPAELEDGEYEVTVTTQYSNSGVLKAPRSAMLTVHIGASRATPNNPDEPVGTDDPVYG
ncbi:MAG: DUF4469 domain-containing protein [Prevotellaceae bacterium]|jgi:hypothetical protein|nr:DUF4469 domain-containing protein [Prevotellaceae bacterium]